MSYRLANLSINQSQGRSSLPLAAHRPRWPYIDPTIQICQRHKSGFYIVLLKNNAFHIKHCPIISPRRTSECKFSRFHPNVPKSTPSTTRFSKKQDMITSFKTPGLRITATKFINKYASYAKRIESLGSGMPARVMMKLTLNIKCKKPDERSGLAS